jgi:hypothetical protein
MRPGSMAILCGRENELAFDWRMRIVFSGNFVRQPLGIASAEKIAQRSPRALGVDNFRTTPVNYIVEMNRAEIDTESRPGRAVGDGRVQVRS